jgi:hypothetical protein
MGDVDILIKKEDLHKNGQASAAEPLFSNAEGPYRVPGPDRG